jgi:hypothetical protein
MTGRRPPALAAWLLRTCGSGPAADALLGDLAEEYRAGRSRAWFWTQALSAIAVSFAAELRGHPLVILRAVCLAWLLTMGLTTLMNESRRYVEAAVDVYLPQHEPYMAQAYRIVDGMRVPQPDRAVSWNRAVYYPAARLVLVCLIGLMTGSLVALLHRRHSVTSVLAAAAAVMTIWIWGVGRSLVAGRPVPPEDVLVVMVPLWVQWQSVLSLGGWIAGVLIGGLTAAHFPRRARHRLAPA